MLILSWNVAGLSTTLAKIHEDYGYISTREKQTSHDEKYLTPGRASNATSKESRETNTQTKKQKLLPCHAFSYFLEQHKADIICIQEHKIPISLISSRSEPFQCSSIPGYESFWSCCVDKTKRGFNGVVTFAKTGSVLAANAACLGSKELDEQGRCIMTDHGSFVLFNVYVPAMSSNKSFEAKYAGKMRFLNALREAMQFQRKERKKNVILVGDLNIVHKAKDVFWKDRLVPVGKVFDEVNACSDHSRLPKWKRDVHEHWDHILSTLKTREAVPRQTKNCCTGETFQKFNVRIKVGEGFQTLGKFEDDAEYAIQRYNFQSATVFDEETKKHRLIKEENLVSIEKLAELMLKIPKVEWTLALQQTIASSDDAGVNPLSPFTSWLNQVMEEDGMVDAFRYFYPEAEARFTCWDQYTNSRYENEGARIDYTLVDKALLDYTCKGDAQSLRCGSTKTNPSNNPLNAKSALLAATANFGFQPAAFGGGGISSATQSVLNTQFGPVHTGIVYTPPSYSDHVGVSVLLDDSLLQPLHLDEKNAATKKAQPHKSQLSIASFFSKGSCSSNSNKPKTLSNGTKIDKMKELSLIKGTKSISASLKRPASMNTSAAVKTKKNNNGNGNTLLSHFSKKQDPILEQKCKDFKTTTTTSWVCKTCTFENSSNHALVCSMCCTSQIPE